MEKLPHRQLPCMFPAHCLIQTRAVYDGGKAIQDGKARAEKNLQHSYRGIDWCSAGSN
jgi:hypothetical protein